MACGLKNWEIPGTPEYGKPPKPESSGGCDSCIKVNDNPIFVEPVLEKKTIVTKRTRTN